MGENDTSSEAIDIPLWMMVSILSSCVLSVVGSLIIIFTYMMWRDQRSKPRKLLVYLSITTFFASASYAYGITRFITSNFTNSVECKVQSGITTFFEIGSYLWTVAIAIYLYAIIVKSSCTVMNILIWIFHAVCWGVPLVTLVLVVIFDVLGYDNSDTTAGWCWVRKHEDSGTWLMWMLIGGNMWEMLAYVFLVFFYILIQIKYNKSVRRLQQQDPERHSEGSVSTVTGTRSNDLQLKAIPVIFIILNLGSTIRFILAFVQSSVVSNPALFLFHGVGDSFQGAANCIIFCLCNKQFRIRFKQSYINLYRRLCCYEENEETQRLLFPTVQMTTDDSEVVVSFN